MNAKIVIPISVIITIVIVVFSLTQSEIIEKQTSEEIIQGSLEMYSPDEDRDSSKIQSMLDKIKNDKIKNDNSYEPYIPTEREWIESGPFQIDKSEYAIGEKIFINIINLNENTKGTMTFTKIINSTHVFEYETIRFDGSLPQQNFYLALNLNKFLGICTTDMLIGDWKLIFDGTIFESLKFKVKSQIIPGLEKQFEPVC